MHQLYFWADAIPPASSAPTFKGVIDLYLAWLADRVRAGTLSPRSYQDTARDLPRFSAWLARAGRYYVHEARRQDPVDFLADQRQWRSDAVRRRVAAYIRACFRRAVREGWIPENPFEKTDWPRFHCAPRNEILPEQYVALMRAAPRHIRRVLYVLWHTGCRPSEVFSITAADLLGPALKVPNKVERHQGPYRLVGLIRPLQRLLARLAQRYPSGPLLRTLKGAAWDYHSFAKRFKQICGRLGLTGVSPYSFRHAFATQAREAGVEALRIDAQLGHSAGLRGLGMLEHYSGRLRLNARYLAQIAEEVARARRTYRLAAAAVRRAG